jgi:hypothetical protein
VPAHGVVALVFQTRIGRMACVIRCINKIRPRLPQGTPYSTGCPRTIRCPGPCLPRFQHRPSPTASGHKMVLSGHTAIRLEDNMIAEEAVWSTERKAQLRPIMGGLVLGLSTTELAPT